MIFAAAHLNGAADFEYAPTDGEPLPGQSKLTLESCVLILATQLIRLVNQVAHLLSTNCASETIGRHIKQTESSNCSRQRRKSGALLKKSLTT